MYFLMHAPIYMSEAVEDGQYAKVAPVEGRVCKHISQGLIQAAW